MTTGINASLETGSGCSGTYTHIFIPDHSFLESQRLLWNYCFPRKKSKASCKSLSRTERGHGLLPKPSFSQLKLPEYKKQGQKHETLCLIWSRSFQVSQNIRKGHILSLFLILLFDHAGGSLDLRQPSTPMNKQYPFPPVLVDSKKSDNVGMIKFLSDLLGVGETWEDMGKLHKLMHQRSTCSTHLHSTCWARQLGSNSRPDCFILFHLNGNNSGHQKKISIWSLVICHDSLLKSDRSPCGFKVVPMQYDIW